MLTADQARLLPRIYDAATSETFWQAALDAVAEACGAKSAVLFALDDVGIPFSVQRSSSLFAEDDLEFYLQNLMTYEQEGWEHLRSKPVRSLILDQTVWPDVDDLKRRPDYDWLRGKAGVARRSAARLNESTGWSDSITLQFCASTDRVPDTLVRQAEAVLPHLAKVVELNRSFSILRTRFEGTLSALDHLKVGVCVTSRKGDVLVANAEADRIFSLRDGLLLGKDQLLRCSSNEETSRLRAAIIDATKTVEGLGGTIQSLITLPRRGARHPLLVEIAPLSDPSGELYTSLAGAIVFIVDPERPGPCSAEGIIRCFGLTSAEAETCRFLIEGLTDSAIADSRAVSMETTKSQIKSIYRKTGTTRRTDLIRLALKITPPIEALRVDEA
jgi:DNA-binding CsgD family transcriptional regulator